MAKSLKSWWRRVYLITIRTGLLVVVGCFCAFGVAAPNGLYALNTTVGGEEHPGRELTLRAFAACTGGNPTSLVAPHPALLLDWAKMRPLKPDLIGFNPSFEASSRSYGNFAGSRFSHLVDLFAPQALRFPPGTYASFYDWDTQIIDEVLARRYSKKPMLDTIQAQRKDNGGRQIIVDYRSFLSLTRSREIRPFIVLNIYTKGADDAHGVVACVRQEISSPINWELGNEPSHVGYASTNPRTAWNADIYAERMTSVSRAIKQQYPGDVIGVEGAELLAARGYTEVPEWIAQYTRQWRNRISANGDDFDAVIFHPYLDILEHVIKAGIQDQKSIPACASWSHEVRRAVVQYQWLFSAAQEVPRAYRIYADSYYPGKQVWLTELGVLRSGKDGLLDLGPNGIPHAMFNVLYFAHWVENLPNLRAYMFHVLDYGKGDFAALNLDGSLNANSVSYLFLQQLLRDATEISVQSFSTGQRLQGTGPYKNIEISSVVALLTNGQKGKRALVVNLGFSAASMAAPFKSSRTVAVGGSPGSIISHGTLWSLEGIPIKTTTERMLNLPPMSITLVEPAS